MSIENVNRSHIFCGWLPAGFREAKIGLGGFLTKTLKSTFGTSGLRASICYLLILSEVRYRLASRWIPR